MGHRSSRTAPEHVRNEDRHSAWGSDIDETFCGPGKICADEWTPLNSIPPSPEETRRRFSVFSIENSEQVITEQPTFVEEVSTWNGSNCDALTILHDDAGSNQFATPIMVAPAPSINTRTKRKKGKKLRRKRRKRNTRITPYDEQGNRRQSTAKNQNSNRRHHRKAIRIRRILTHHDPRYPMIPPPAYRLHLKFRKCHPDDKFRYTKAVPPSHLKGISVTPKPPFRYKGVQKIIM